MDALLQLFLGGLVLDAVTESIKIIIKAVKDREGHLENLGSILFAFFFAMALRLNIFLLVGIEGSGDLFYFMSYITFAIVGMRGSGFIHDLIRKTTQQSDF